MRGQPQNQNSQSQVHVSSKGKGLRVKKKQPISREMFEVVEKDQNLQQVLELKIEDITFQKFDEDFVENIVEDPTVVIHGNESIIHNPKVSVDLLRMTTQYVDFLE